MILEDHGVVYYFEHINPIIAQWSSHLKLEIHSSAWVAMKSCNPLEPEESLIFATCFISLTKHTK